MPDQVICHQPHFKKKGTEFPQMTKQLSATFFAARLKLFFKPFKMWNFFLESLCERRSLLVGPQTKPMPETSRSVMNYKELPHYNLDEILSSSYC